MQSDKTRMVICGSREVNVNPRVQSLYCPLRDTGNVNSLESYSAFGDTEGIFFSVPDLPTAYSANFRKKAGYGEHETLSSIHLLFIAKNNVSNWQSLMQVVMTW